MSSIFDLKTSVDELSSMNEGTSRMEYDQHPPTRDVTGDNFANGSIHFRWSVSGQKWWIPSRSYIRTRFELTKGDGTTQLVTADEIAPNMGLMSNLFQSAEFRINDKVVSRVADFMPQVDALETRLCKSKSWLDSVGEATNWWEEDQKIRLAEVTSDGAIVKNEVPTVATETTSLDTAIGYAATNSIEYVAATGIITFAAGGGGAPPNSDVNFQVGDFVVFDAVSGGETGVLGVRMRVIEAPANLTLRVEPVGAVDVAAANGNRISRIRANPPAVAPPSRRVGNFETIYQPPLSIFKIGHALPSMRAELVLNPQTAQAYQKRAIESVLGVASKTPTLPGGAPADFKVKIVNMYLYCCTVEGPRSDDVTYLLDLEQTRCQSDKIDSENFQQKSFDVSPSTYALTVCFQDQRAGENTAISASKFKSYNNAGGGLVPDASEELKLNRFFVNYAGQNLPAPDADPDFKAGRDYTIQRYTDTQIYSGGYYDTGGAETIEEFHQRGAYYYQAFPRDGTDRSTRVTVHQQFELGASTTNMRVLLFDHSKQIARIKVSDGHVVDVQVEDS